MITFARQCTLFILIIILGSGYVYSYADSHLDLTKTTFSSLPGWEMDNHEKALRAFIQSCVAISRQEPDLQFHPAIPQLTSRDWQVVCNAANKLHKIDDAKAREFFETWFAPFHVADDDNNGLFTGYYLPVINASLKHSKQFNVPIYALPDDLVKMDLGIFREEFAGKSIVGQVKDNALFPYPTRDAINQGVIRKNAKVLAWSDDPVDVYFAQVQGSTLVRLANKQPFIIGYAGDNGRTYVSIGKVLIARGELTKENVSMQSIRDWLTRHPKQAHALLNQNTSYVFFKVLNEANPLGTQRIPLTPERSLAIDNRYIPFGAPIWVNTVVPVETSKRPQPFQRLLIAQDTGGAIKGMVRGDIYWGAGEKAEFIAGHMNSPGEYWILLPRT